MIVTNLQCKSCTVTLNISAPKFFGDVMLTKNEFMMHGPYAPGGVLNFELGTDVRPEVSTTTL